MFKKTFLIFICLSLLISVFSACGDNEETKSEEPVVKISWFSHRTDFEKTVLAQYKKEFEKENPNIEISFSTQKDYKEVLRIKMASNSMPDVFGLAPSDYTKEQLSANCYVVDDLPYADQFECMDIYTGTEGEMIGFPSGMGPTAVVYNKNIFEEVGVEVPTTLTEFIEVGQKIKEAGYLGLATSAKAKWTLGNFYGALAMAISGDENYMNDMVNSDEPFKEGEPIYEALKIVEKLKEAEIIEDYPLKSDWEPTKKEFINGKVGMFYLGIWFVPQVLSEDIKGELELGMFPFPYNDKDGVKNVVLGPDYGWAMSNDSENVDAQRKFFDFLVDTKYSDWAQKTGVKSARKDKEVEMSVFKYFEENDINEIYSISETNEYSKIKERIQLDDAAIIQNILSGQKTVDEIAEDMNKKWKK
jgi:ABC-type glycerol-3-phosphate transport system substrate-binding protein